MARRESADYDEGKTSHSGSYSSGTRPGRQEEESRYSHGGRNEGRTGEHGESRPSGYGESHVASSTVGKHNVEGDGQGRQGYPDYGEDSARQQGFGQGYQQGQQGYQQGQQGYQQGQQGYQQGQQGYQQGQQGYQQGQQGYQQPQQGQQGYQQPQQGQQGQQGYQQPQQGQQGYQQPQQGQQGYQQGYQQGQQGYQQPQQGQQGQGSPAPAEGGKSPFSPDLIKNVAVGAGAAVGGLLLAKTYKKYRDKQQEGKPGSSGSHSKREVSE